MIKPGTNLCRVCGRTSHVHYYRSGKIDEGAQLIFDPVRKEYALQHYRGENRTKGDAQPHSFLLVDPERYADGDFPPDYVQAKIDGEQEVTTMYRSCPECDGYELFPPDMGKLACFVIAVIGAVSAGKTAWLGALNNALDALNKQSYPFRIEPWQLRGDTEYVKSTRGYENGNTNYFLIRDVQTEENVAMVYLLDYAGELYAGQEVNPDTPVGRILLGEAGRGYPGLDGAVFIEPAVSDPLNKDRSGTDKVIGVIQNTKTILRRIPVARVCTFADKLIQQIEKMRDEDICGAEEQIPLLSRKTFPQTVYGDAGTVNARANKNLLRFYEPGTIRNRVRLQDHIARNLPDCEVGAALNAVLFGNKQYGHFLVQSCEHIPPEDSAPAGAGNKSQGSNNYRMQFNVADPLIWLLYKLKLFPLDLQEGGNR